MDYRKLYNENDDFKKYVDHYAKNHTQSESISVSEALTHIIVQETGKQYASCSEKVQCEERQGYGC